MDKAGAFGKKLYIVLWGGAFVILCTMIMINRLQSDAEKRRQQSRVISRLYKDSDDVSISAKNAFINLLLRNESNDVFILPSPSSGRALRVMLHSGSGFRIKPAPEEFSIRPVPR